MKTNFIKSGIYQIINKIDKKIYIGSSRRITSRFYTHEYLLNKNLIYKKQYKIDLVKSDKLLERPEEVNQQPI